MLFGLRQRGAGRSKGANGPAGKFELSSGNSITDLNESTKIYYVDYVKPEASFWASIWGESLPVVELPNGKYQFQVEKMAAKSAVTLYDSEGNALPEETLEKIFDVMEAGLSFKDVF